MASTGTELELPLFWGRKKRLHYVMSDSKSDDNQVEPKRKQMRSFEKSINEDSMLNAREKKHDMTSNMKNNLTFTSQERRTSRQDRLPEPVKIPKLFITLTHNEKAQDFAAIGQTKFSSRPKRRYPKAVKDIFEFITPGNCLSNICMDRYEVKEKPSKKKSSGLKALALKHKLRPKANL